MSLFNYHVETERQGCKGFLSDLLMFLKDIVSDMREQQHLQRNLEISFKQCHTNDEDRIHANAKLRLQKMCTMIVEELKKQDKRNGIKAFADAFNAICFIYQNYSIQEHRNVEFVRSVIALKGNSDFMKLLVNLDLLTSLHKAASEYFIETRTLIFLQHFLLKIKFEYDSNLQQIFYMFKSIIFPCGNPLRSLERVYLIILALHAAYFKLSNEENAAKEYIYCLRMYFITTRDPYITINEVRTMLYVCLFALKELHLFESISDEFVKIMPECPAKMEPRTLTDLARCQIRDSLKTCNLPLPVAVMQLNLSKRLKEFVLGDVIQMAKMNGNVYMEQVITMSQLEPLVVDILPSIRLPQGTWQYSQLFRAQNL